VGTYSYYVLTKFKVTSKAQCTIQTLGRNGRRVAQRRPSQEDSNTWAFEYLSENRNALKDWRQFQGSEYRPEQAINQVAAINSPCMRAWGHGVHV
jgi:hypothetical protein